MKIYTVPFEPTEEMIQAGCLSQSYEHYDTYEEWWDSHSSGISERIRDMIVKDYKAMLLASESKYES